MRTSVLVAGVLALLIVGCAATPRAHVEVTPYTPPAATGLELDLPEGHTAGESVDVGDIQIIAVNNPRAPANTEYLTLHEALKANLCTVAEKDGVNGLAITNRSKQPIFLMVGDLVLGGKQDRIMAESIVVEAGADGETIPVFCVEHGRWSEEAGSIEFYARDKAQQADVSVKSAAISTGNQSAVWAAVAENNTTLGVRTASGTFRATFDDAETVAKLDAMYAKAKAVQAADTVGFAVIYKNEVVAMDLFDSKGLCAKLSEKLLRSYLVTAMTNGYEPAPPHPLATRLQDRVTLQVDGLRVSRVVAELNKQWSVEVSFAGEEGELVTLELNDATVLEALVQLAVAGRAYITIGVGSVQLTANADHAGEVYARSTAGGQFDSGSGGIAQANPTSGIFFNGLQGTSVNFNQDIRGRFGGDSEDDNLEGQPANLGGFGISTGYSDTDLPAAATNINESTETERSYDGDGVDYSCKDSKRGATVHRAYMRR